MVYLHEKKIGSKKYYSLRESKRKGKKIITKIIYNFGLELSKNNIRKIPTGIKKQIKNMDRIKKKIEEDYYLKKTLKKDIKKDRFFNERQLNEINAVLMHFKKKQ